MRGGEEHSPPLCYLCWEREGQWHLLIQWVKSMEGAKEITVNARRVDLKVHGTFICSGERDRGWFPKCRVCVPEAI